MVIKNIIFDWSGTLADDFRYSYRATRDTIRHFGGPTLTSQQYRAEFMLPVRHFYRKFLGTKVLLDEIDRYYFDHFTQFARRAPLFPEVRTIISELGRQSIRIAVCSTVRHSLLESLCRQHRLPIKHLYGGVRDKGRALGKILRTLSMKPAQTVFIGDMEHDIEAARQYGLRAGVVLCGYRSADQLLARVPNYVWNDHAGLYKFIRTLPLKRLPDQGRGPLATVGALIFNRGDIFLVQTHKWGHTFGIPGGKVDYGETMIEALKREIREETGLSVHKIRFALIQDSIASPEFYKTKSHFLLTNFFAETDSRRFRLNEEAESGIWVSPRLALKFNLNAPTRALIERYLL